MKGHGVVAMAVSVIPGAIVGYIVSAAPVSVDFVITAGLVGAVVIGAAGFAVWWWVEEWKVSREVTRPDPQPPNRDPLYWADAWAAKAKREAKGKDAA